MSGATAFLQDLGIDTFPVVANAEAQHIVVVSDLRLDSMCMSMPKSVPQDFECDPTDIVFNRRIQGLPLALLD
jgi:hypothetical protein